MVSVTDRRAFPLNYSEFAMGKCSMGGHQGMAIEKVNISLANSLVLNGVSSATIQRVSDIRHQISDIRYQISEIG